MSSLCLRSYCAMLLLVPPFLANEHGDLANVERHCQHKLACSLAPDHGKFPRWAVRLSNLSGRLEQIHAQETLFAARREARSVAFQYRGRLSLLLRRLFFGLRVNSNRIARRKSLFERFVELFVRGHRRFPLPDFRLPGGDAAYLSHVELHEGTSGISLLQRRRVHAITVIEAEIATFITQIENRGIDDIQIDVTDLPGGARARA